MSKELSDAQKLEKVRKLYRRRMEETAEKCSDDEEMFLYELSEIILDDDDIPAPSPQDIAQLYERAAQDREQQEFNTALHKRNRLRTLDEENDIPKVVREFREMGIENIRQEILKRRNLSEVASKQARRLSHLDEL